MAVVECVGGAVENKEQAPGVGTTEIELLQE